MAEILFEKVKPVLGKQVLDIFTSGMYDNPLSVYREYLQNAADSFDSNMLNEGDQSGHFIQINIDGNKRSITIEDNGQGVATKHVEARLLNIGCSNKVDTASRGFRGIGRLGGLGYCKKLIMETKAVGEKEASVIIWDGELLRDLVVQTNPEYNAVQLVSRVCSVHKTVAHERVNESYFKVTMQNIKKFHSDELLNVKSVRKYISKTAPVPYKESFSFSTTIEKHIAPVENYRHYNIYVNGEQVYKPYEDVIVLSTEKKDRILNVELFTFRDNNGDDLAYGWYAKSKYSSSIPINCNSRGILVRDGNIAVGNEYFLSDYYKEKRFATWHIGEIFLACGKVKANARRDGFEQNSHYESFCEQATILGQHLSRVVRDASKLRSAEQRAVSKIETIEKMTKSGSIFVDQEDFNLRLKYIRTEIKKVEELFTTNQFLNGLDRRFKQVQLKLVDFVSNKRLLKNSLDGRRLRKNDKKEIVESICMTIKHNYETTSCAEELIAKVLIPYSKGN